MKTLIKCISDIRDAFEEDDFESARAIVNGDVMRDAENAVYAQLDRTAAALRMVVAAADADINASDSEVMAAIDWPMIRAALAATEHK